MAGRYGGLTRATKRAPKGRIWTFHVWSLALLGERWGGYGGLSRTG